VSVAIFSLTLFVSAALLFLMELMFAKITLPVLGGTTAVWTTCMLFYQAMLLAGYAYANEATRRITSRWQALLFVGLAFAPLMILPFSLPAGRVPPVERNPVPWLLMMLTFVVGLTIFRAVNRRADSPEVVCRHWPPAFRSYLPRIGNMDL
jgi:hypothetical protein